MVLPFFHLSLIMLDEISILGILENCTFDNIQLGMSLGLKPGLIATINLHSFKIFFEFFHSWKFFKVSLPIK